MVKAVIFDFFGVLEKDGEPNQPLLTYVRAKLKPNYKLGIISNAAADWVREVLSKDDVDLFDSILISHQAGVAKPEPAIYHLSLEKLGIRADESVFVDDILRYCEAAQSVGMQAIHYTELESALEQLEKLLAVSDN